MTPRSRVLEKLMVTHEAENVPPFWSLFIYGLFNELVSSSDCTASNDEISNKMGWPCFVFSYRMEYSQQFVPKHTVKKFSSRVRDEMLQEIA
jgi:hypothetical protein